jgi:hypothetical protein
MFTNITYLQSRRKQSAPFKAKALKFLFHNFGEKCKGLRLALSFARKGLVSLQL